MRPASILLIAALLPMSLAQVERGAPLPRKGILGVQSTAVAQGLQISRIFPGLTGDSIGLKVNDTVEDINQKAFKSPGDMVAYIHSLDAGAKLRVRFLRDGKEQVAEGLLGERPRQTEPGLEVLYDQVLSQGNRIRVIATKPAGNGPFPTLFLIGGIGGYSIDGPYASTLYGDVLGPIAHAGYAVVRIDKPGQGDSEGPAYKDLTFKRELAAYIQALRLAKTFSFVDPKRVVIYGHSMGGTFGPLVADVEPVKAVIVNGTLFQGFQEYMVENSRRQAELSDEPEPKIDSDQKNLIAVMGYLFDEDQMPKDVVAKHPDLEPYIKENFPDGETYSGVGIKFFRELSHINLAEAWSKANCDVLSLYNENDFLSGQADHERIATFVNKLRPGTATFQLLRGIDHAFMKTTSMRDSQTNWGKRGEFNPVIDDALLAFLKKEVGP